MTDDPVVKAKEAVKEIAIESSMKYEMLKCTDAMSGKVKYNG